LYNLFENNGPIITLQFKYVTTEGQKPKQHPHHHERFLQAIKAEQDDMEEAGVCVCVCVCCSVNLLECLQRLILQNVCVKALIKS